MKGNKYGTPRKKKALRRSLFCLFLLPLFLLLHFYNYNFTMEQALGDAELHYGTGELTVIRNLGQPVDDERFPEFYLCANENALLHIGFDHSNWKGWKTSSAALLDCSGDSGIHVLHHYLHTFYNRGNLKVSSVFIGRVDDEAIQRVEILIQSYDRDKDDIILETDEFIEYEGARYFLLSHNGRDPTGAQHTVSTYGAGNTLLSSSELNNDYSSRVDR